MPRGKKELAEQIIPKTARGRSRSGVRQDRCRGGQEDRCDGADWAVFSVSVTRLMSVVFSTGSPMVPYVQSSKSRYAHDLCPNCRWTPRSSISRTNAEKSSSRWALLLSVYPCGICGIVLANTHSWSPMNCWISLSFIRCPKPSFDALRLWRIKLLTRPFHPIRYCRCSSGL